MLISSFLDSCKYWTESSLQPKLRAHLNPLVTKLTSLNQQIPGPISQERLNEIKQVTNQIKTSIESTVTYQNRIQAVTLDDNLAIMQTAYAIFEDYFSPFPDDRINITCVKDISNAIQEMKETIKTTMFKNIENYLNTHDGLSGIWYPVDYENAVQEPIDVTFFSGHADEEFFQKIALYTFEVKNGKLPSEAVIKFLEGPTITDCGSALAACFYKTLFDIVGEKFNILFQLEGFQLKINQFLLGNESPSRFFIDFTINSFARKNLLPREVGEWVYIHGVPEELYCFRHPMGCDRGLHAIYRGKNENNEETFIGHFHKEAKTEKEIVSLLIEAYNQTPTRHDEWDMKENKAEAEASRKNFENYVKERKIDPRELLSGLSISKLEEYKIKTGLSEDSNSQIKAHLVLQLLLADNIPACANRLIQQERICCQRNV